LIYVKRLAIVWLNGALQCDAWLPERKRQAC
jgi:hypothetical protein